MLRVVCVDDERAALKNVLALCARIPEISDAQGFAGAEEAIAWLRGHPCDLALLDICLPGMDGIALAKKIRELQPETGIVFVTGYARYAVDAWAIHACGYVMKPATPERLREEVAHALSLRARRKEDRLLHDLSGQQQGRAHAAAALRQDERHRRQPLHRQQREDREGHLRLL